jgi:hypothetical protein
MIGLPMALVGGGAAQWVTGGRSGLTGWFLSERDGKKRRVRIEQRFPRIGCWILPASYAVGVIGVLLFAWGAFASL